MDTDEADNDEQAEIGEACERIDMALLGDDGRLAERALRDCPQWVCSDQAGLDNVEANPVSASVLLGKPECFRAFLEWTDCEKWRFGEDGPTLAHVAAAAGALWALEALADKDPDFDFFSRMDGRTPLSVACCAACLPCAEFLAEKSGPPSGKASLGFPSAGKWPAQAAWPLFDMADAIDQGDAPRASAVEACIRACAGVPGFLSGRISALGALARKNFAEGQVTQGSLRAIALAMELGTPFSSDCPGSVPEALRSAEPGSLSLLAYACAETDPILVRCALQDPCGPDERAAALQIMGQSSALRWIGACSLRNGFSGQPELGAAMALLGAAPETLPFWDRLASGAASKSLYPADKACELLAGFMDGGAVLPQGAYPCANAALLALRKTQPGKTAPEESLARWAADTGKGALFAASACLGRSPFEDPALCARFLQAALSRPSKAQTQNARDAHRACAVAACAALGLHSAAESFASFADADPSPAQALALSQALELAFNTLDRAPAAAKAPRI